MDLEAVQSRLVCELLEADPVFRAAFLRDPESACRGRGFRFVTRDPGAHWHLRGDARVYSYGRPS
jgi:hypothetical protein